MSMQGGLLFLAHRVGTILVLLAVGLTCGCGGGAPVKKPDQGQQATIWGKVTLDGSKAIPANCDVVFFCAEKAATASGRSDEKGSYALKSADKTVGIPAGRYQVMIRPAPPKPTAVGTEDYKAKMMGGSETKRVDVLSDIPAKFHAFDTSKIDLEIKPGNNPIDLDLSKF